MLIFSKFIYEIDLPLKTIFYNSSLLILLAILFLLKSKFQFKFSLQLLIQREFRLQ